MKTINLRKRQYKKCQFCGMKVAVEHRFDKNTCYGCATEHYGVVYYSEYSVKLTYESAIKDV